MRFPLSCRRALPLLLLAAAAGSAGSAPSKSETREIHFVIIDHRKLAGRYYVEAANQFKKSVEARTAGRVHVTLVDLAVLGDVKRESAQIALQKLAAGEIEMANLRGDAVARLYDHRLAVFDMPYLIQDYAHAARIVEGPVGRRLVERLPEHGMTSLAYTYSGGFRVLASRSPVSVDSLRGLKVAMTQIPLEIEQYKAWGAQTVPTPKEDFMRVVSEGQADAVEVTWNCYEGTPGLARALPYVTEMENNFYVTMMLINSKFLGSLSAGDRAALVASAEEAAQFERQVTISGNEQIKERHRRAGRHVAVLSKEDRRALSRAAEPVRESFADFVGRDILSAVRAEAGAVLAGR